MSLIALEGMRFYAYHGVYQEERIIGNYYVVDIYIETTFTKAAVDDDLSQTINYETVYLICKTVMRKKTLLLETIAHRIALAIKYQFGNIKELKVRVKKLNPPVGGMLDCAYVQIDGQYSKKCARCERPLLCYGDNTCWCMDTQLYEKTLQQLKQQFGNQCLCKDCLHFYTS